MPNACGQYISKKRPSRSVILSAAKDCCVRREILRCAQDDTPGAQDDTPGAQDDTAESAAFDAHIVFFEMD
ncbi:MAG TPA: hypothetical protein VJQ26_05480 [Ktedonobacteraceae bacterium]|nr:hypothetical protein [Ktedonobacteraceae bacterium]